MLMKMFADMVGMSPETMQAEIEGFATLAKESHAALSRIEANQTEILQLLKAQANDRHDNNGASPGS